MCSQDKTTKEIMTEAQAFTQFMQKCCRPGDTFDDVIKHMEIPTSRGEGIEIIVNSLIDAFEGRLGRDLTAIEADYLGDVLFHSIMLGRHLGKKELL